MSTENIVYLAIGWLSILTALFMFMILYIHHVEIKNSRKMLNMKLVMHYNHRFHRMRIAVEKYHLFKHDDPQTVEEMIQLFDQNHRVLHESVKTLSDEVTLNCVNNQFLFIHSTTLRFTLTLKAKEVIDIYQEWVDLLRHFDNCIHEDNQSETHMSDEEMKELWESFNLRYLKLIDHVIEMCALLTNESVMDVLNKK